MNHFEQRISSVCNCLWEIDSVAHVGNTSKSIYQGTIGAADGPVICVSMSFNLLKLHYSEINTLFIKIAVNINGKCRKFSAYVDAPSMAPPIPAPPKNARQPVGRFPLPR